MKNSLPRLATLLLCLASFLLVFGGLPLHAQAVLPVTVTVAPGPVSVIGGGIQQFAATVGNTANTAVTWSVNGVVGGNATVGTISPTGLYTAPAVIPGTIVRVVKATSQADATKFGSANVTCLALTLSVTPGAVTLLDGQTQQFIPTVGNATNTAVTWEVNGVVGGSAATGTISTTGLYTAPAAIAPAVTAVTVTTIAQGDTTKQFRSVVTLNGILVSVAPTAVSLTAEATQQFVTTITNAPSQGLIWAVNGVVGGNTTVGTVSATGLYQAPVVIAKQTMVQLLVRSKVDVSKAAVAAITLEPPVTVTLTPVIASVIGGGTQQFAAVVANTANTALTWTVNGVVGGNATVGTISTTGLYTAPAVIPGTIVRVVKAISQADPTKSASANVTCLALTLTVTPGTVSLLDGQTQQFTATVGNATNTALTWQVNGVTGGSATTGTISATGLYTAPVAIAPAVTAVTVTTIAQADTTKQVRSVVTLNGIVIAVAPTAVSLNSGATQQFSTTITNAPSQGVTWAISGVVGGNATVGTISASGLYQAPATITKQTTLQLLVRSQVDPGKAAVAAITLVPSVAVAVTPATASVIGGGSQQLIAVVSNTTNTGVSWTVNGIAGGNATLGTISVAGLYMAPAVISAQTTVTATATSVADATKSSSSLLTLLPLAVTGSPLTASLRAGATQQFTAAVTNATNPAITWTVNAIAGGNATVGTISTTGLYTAPAVVSAQTTVTVKAASVADPTKSITAVVTLLPITITASPLTASLTGGATQQFTATVTNAANPAVTWSVNAIVGGNATVGTISTAGLYKAPTVIPSQTTVTVKAASVADATKSISATVTLAAAGVTISPNATTSLSAGGTKQFTATVTNATNTAVTWQVNGITGGGTAAGTISTTGLYTAPATIASPATVTVAAVSQADPTKSASAQVSLLALSITISPTSQTLAGGATQQFTAAVTNAANAAVTWQVNGVTGGSATTGTISTSGLYTAPAGVAAQTVVTVTAVSQADASKSATAQVTIGVLTITLTPATASLATGATQQFTATVLNTSNTAVVWKVNGVIGGNVTLGTISTAGLYTAPASLAAATTVTVAAVSQANATKSATALVTVTPTAVKPVTITVSPTTAALGTAATQQFTVSVLNTVNTAVVWKVNGVVGGNATLGTVSTTGLYTSPASLAAKTTVTVAAVSQADTTKSATAAVTVTPAAPAPGGNAFYVATTGNDANAGTLASPWKTISHAASSSSVQPGATVYVRGGTYAESVTIGVSGTAAGQIVFQNYPGEKPVLDGTTLTPPTDQHGLFTIVSQSYVTVSGFEVRNYKTSSADAVPAGIWISGSGTNIRILNNIVHDIQTSSEAQGNAFGIAAYGTDAPASLDQITIDGNQVYNLRTGGSESVNVDGNVTNFAITNNIVHDNDNIAIDAIGNEGVSSNATYDHARNGVISDNTIYNISGKTNPGEGDDYDADGVYVDGGTQIVIERNLIHNVDIGIEAASEHKGTSTTLITIRNNVVYASNITGISIGGYDSTVGGADHITIVNNTLYGNDTQTSGSGEFQVQYYATNNVFKNNIVYATTQGLFINNYTNTEANPVDVDYNLYYSTSGASEFLWNASDYASFASYQSATGKDAHSQFANPFFLNLNLSGLNLDILVTSPAVNKGINLGATVEGPLDFAGGARVQGTNIDIGAFEQ